MRVDVASQIKEYRKKRGYTIDKMVELTGINKSNYSQMENGKLNLTIDSLSKICTVLKVSLKLEEQKKGQNS